MQILAFTGSSLGQLSNYWFFLHHVKAFSRNLVTDSATCALLHTAGYKPVHGIIPTLYIYILWVFFKSVLSCNFFRQVWGLFLLVGVFLGVFKKILKSNCQARPRSDPSSLMIRLIVHTSKSCKDSFSECFSCWELRPWKIELLSCCDYSNFLQKITRLFCVDGE